MNSFLHSLLRHASERPHAVALVDVNVDRQRSITWGVLVDLVLAKRRELAERFSLSSDSLTPFPIGYECQNSCAQVVFSLACQALGAIEVPIDVRGGAQYTRRCREIVRPHWYDCDQLEIDWDSDHADSTKTCDGLETSLARLSECADSVRMDAPALVLFTSGTTGPSKGAVLSHRSLVVNAAAKLAKVPQWSDDVRLTLLSFAHAYARTCDLGTWLLSGCTLVPAYGYEGWMTFAYRIKPSLVNCVPRLADRILGRPRPELIRETARLRILGCGGAAMNARDFDRWRELGVTVIQGYGLTEAGPVVASASPDDARPGCVGGIVEGWSCRIDEGRLSVRGVHAMLGYWPSGEAWPRRDLRAVALEARSRWLDTGDLVEFDRESGQLRILGRADDVIVLTDGHKVHPVMVEKAISGSEQIRHAFLTAVEGRLELWVQNESLAYELSDQQICDRLAEFPSWSQPKRIRRFPVPLESTPGALTAKGTICRPQVELFVQGLQE